MKLNNGIFVPFSYEKEKESIKYVYKFEGYERVVTNQIYQSILKEEKSTHNWKKEGF